MRDGSRGVPNKNLRMLHGKPLMAHTIRQALESGLFEHVVVSTDSDKIAEAARAFGAEAWFLRPAEMATDEAPKLPVIRHAFLEAERHYGHRFDVLVDMDATSPLRLVDDIAKAYEQFADEGADTLITANPARKNPYFNMVEVLRGSLDLVKHSGLNKILIGGDASIREALNALSKSGEKCLMVTDPNRKLLGTLSDGDLRKALLRDADIDQPITDVYNRDSIYLTRDSFQTAHAKKLFLDNKFDLIPIVDNKGLIVDFVVWEELFIQDPALASTRQSNMSLNIPTRRQDAPQVYDVNASIYIWKRQALLEKDTLFTDKTSLYIMPEERSVDIDTNLDWDFVEFIMANTVNSDG